MSAISITTLARQPIRWPFRILAGIICVAGLCALAAIPLLMIRHDNKLALQEVVGLPGMLWLLNLAFFAARDGRVTADTVHWPFASMNVFYFYMLVFTAYSWFGTR